MSRKVEAYVFVDTENPGPKRVVREIRKPAGVDIASMDAVIDRIAELDGVRDTDSKVVHQPPTVGARRGSG